MDHTVTTIFYNAIVRTMEPGQPQQQAVAVRGNRVCAVGGNDEILALAQDGTLRVDLEGKLLLPGFIDSHMHILLSGSHDSRLDLSGSASTQELVERGRRYIEEHRVPPGQWIEGFGFDQNRFADGKLPDKALADQISTKHPVILNRVCYHLAVANSAALAQLDASYHAPESDVERDGDGGLTGVFREEGVNWLKSHVPAATVEQMQRDILSTAGKMLRCGITSAHSNDMGNGDNKEMVYRAYRNLVEKGELPVRVFQEVTQDSAEELREYLARRGEWDIPHPRFRIGNIKIIADGGLGAQTAYLRAPYADNPATCGIQNFSQEQLDGIIGIAHQADMQVAVHAIGDGALQQVIDAVAAAQKITPKALRHRVVHCQIGDARQYAAMKGLGICADIQPPFLAGDYKIVDQRLGGKRAAASYAWKTLLDLGIPLGGGSDAPVESYDPLWGIYCAVTRKDDAGNPNGGWHPEQCLAVEQAVRLYTAGGAYLAFEEGEKGVIAPGRLADFTLLSQDIFTLPPQAILETKVEMTVVDGQIQYAL